MPRKTYTTQADFDADYNVGAEPDGHPGTRQKIRVGYVRAGMWPYAVNRAAKLVELFAWPTSTPILVVGAGYAWTAEALETIHGYTNIVTTDTSPHVQATQDQGDESLIDAAITAVGLDPAMGEGLAKKNAIWTAGPRRRHSRDVKDEDLSNNGSRNRIRNVLGSVDVAISENVATVLDDSEVTQIADWIDNVDSLSQVIHLVTELLPDHNQNPVFNWKSLADWKALVPSHTWVSLNTWEVL